MPPTNIVPPALPTQSSYIGVKEPPRVFRSLARGIKALAYNIATIILLIVLTIVISIVLSLPQYFLNSSSSSQAISDTPLYLVSNILNLFVNSFIFAALAFTILASLHKRKASITEAAKWGLRNIIRFSLIHIIIAIIIAPVIYVFMILMIFPLSLFFTGLTSPFGALYVVVIGLPIAFLLAVPLIGRLVFSYGFAIDEPSMGVFSTIKSSWRLSKGYTWKIAAILYITVILPAVSIFFMVWGLASLEFLSLASSASILLTAVIIAISLLVTYIFSFSALLTFYSDLHNTPLASELADNLAPPSTPPSENAPTNLSQPNANTLTPPLNSVSSTPTSDSPTEIPTEPQSATHPQGSNPAPPPQTPPQI